MSRDNAVLARNTEKAPQNLGISSQTVAFSHYNHLSAQLPIDLATGQIVAGGIVEQAKQCLTHIKTIVNSIDHGMDDVVRLTVFLADIADLNAVNEVIATFFTDYLPTRTSVAVAALPMDALVQMEAVVSNGVGTIPDAPQAGDLVKLVRNTDAAPHCCTASTQTVAFSHYNNLSAQLPIDVATGKLVAGGVVEQTRQCLANVKTILESIDFPCDDIVKITIFVTKLSDIEAVNTVYETFFPDSAIARAVGYLPARTVVVASALPLGALVQIEAVVSHGDGTPPQEVEDRHGIIVEANNTDAAPRCCNLTQTVAFSHYNNISMQLPVDPRTKTLVTGGVKEQTKQCFMNLQTVVESVDHNLADVVKVNIFLKDLADLTTVDEVYATFFPGGIPARRVIGVADLPKGASIQIDAVASNAEGTPPEI
ncbi:MAG: RidA family protein [Propionibacteriaceae bacterium]